MFSLPAENWVRLVVWLAIGLVIYFGYSRKHSVVARVLGEQGRLGAAGLLAGDWGWELGRAAG